MQEQLPRSPSQNRQAQAESLPSSAQSFLGGVAERLNAPVLTRRRERKSGGRRPGRSPEGMEPEPKPASAG